MNSEYYHRSKIPLLLGGAVTCLCLLGWILFFYSNSSNKQKKLDQEASIAKYQEKIQQLETDNEVIEFVSEKNIRKFTQKSNEITQDLEKTKQEALRQSSELQQHKEALEATRQQLEQSEEKFKKLLEKKHKDLSELPPSDASLTAWSQLIKEFPSNDEEQDLLRHLKIAELYYQIGHFQKVRDHLELAKSINPKIEQQLLKNLNIEQIIANINKDIEQKLPKEQILLKLNQAHDQVNTLAKNPAEKQSVEKYTATLLSLETKIILNASPKNALNELLTLIKSNKKIASSAESSLLFKLNYLNNLTKAYRLSFALSETSKSSEIKNEIYLTSKWINDLQANHPDIAFAKATVALSELDALFLVGNSRQLLNKVSSIQDICKTATPEDKIYFESATSGHKASVYVEKGQISNGRAILEKGIQNLSKFDKKSRHANLAQFRLATLYWLQAQFTTKASSSIQSLNKSTSTLKPLIQHAEITEAREIIQFSATVEGELAELSERLGKRPEAKTHYTNSLTLWQKILTDWGSNEEARAAVSYCKWRIGQL